MVKGISRQVIVVHSPEPKLFEQAIFILKEDALRQEGVTDDLLRVLPTLMPPRIVPPAVLTVLLDEELPVETEFLLSVWALRPW